MTQLAKVFALNRKGLNVVRGVTVAAATMLLPLIVLTALGLEHYWISMSFGALFVWLSDPGGDYAFRVRDMALVGVIGALLTALGYGIGAGPWGFVVLAAFVVTVLAGLAVKYGAHRFVAALLLNIWLLVALALPGVYHLDHIQTNAWAQAGLVQIRRTQAADLCAIGPDQASRLLRRLARAGKLTRRGERRGAVYVKPET